jgi:hypothetical protein
LYIVAVERKKECKKLKKEEEEEKDPRVIAEKRLRLSCFIPCILLSFSLTFCRISVASFFLFSCVFLA